MTRNKPFSASMHLAMVLVLAVATVACAGKKQEYVERPVEELYNEAMDALLDQDYVTSTAKFDEVERQHPYSLWANKAQLMAAYSYYLNNLYDEAIIALDRFIQLHPTSKDIAYAYYLKGLSYYEQISDVARDQMMTELAQNTLGELIKRFPRSKYARDAKLKLDLTRDHLAGKEMEIGRYYHKQRQYLAAINRFKSVVDNYQTTTHVPEALHRLTEAYLAFGLENEARKTAAVLGHNFPGSEWYLDSYKIMGNEVAEPKESKPWYKPW
ncbi:MAG: outer membrane protein assembly factor BamD [Rhodospirillales bacterium]|nr:outer membrane protein assembly factor BamD [Alphaproteobacteria bacterium]MBL6947282.1 outer membrane protein assembly factor BamD [Rhodospirillales bacterium]